MTICLQHSSHGNSNFVCRSSEIFAAQTKCLKCRLKRISNDLRILGLHISRKNIRFRDLKKKKNHLKNYAKHACRYNEEIMLREETDFYRTLMKSVI